MDSGEPVEKRPPAAADVEHVAAAHPEAVREEVVGQVVVVADGARRRAHRGQPPGAGHGPLATGGLVAPAARWAATSPTVRSWPSPRRTSIGSSMPVRISTSVMISAAASESMPRSSSFEFWLTSAAGTPQILAIDSYSAA